MDHFSEDKIYMLDLFSGGGRIANILDDKMRIQKEPNNKMKCYKTKVSELRLKKKKSTNNI